MAQPVFMLVKRWAKGWRIRGERVHACLFEKKETACQPAAKKKVWRKEKGDAGDGEGGRGKDLKLGKEGEEEEEEEVVVVVVEERRYGEIWREEGERRSLHP